MRCLVLVTPRETQQSCPSLGADCMSCGTPELGGRDDKMERNHFVLTGESWSYETLRVREIL